MDAKPHAAREAEATRFPLTEAQSGLWYAQKIEPDNPILNTGQYLEIVGALDVDAFCAAFARMAAETDALALRFAETPEGVVQFVDEALRPTLEIVDLRGEDDAEAAALVAMRLDADTPVDPTRDPLSAFRLFVVGENRFFWYERVHHLAIDGYGWVLITNRVAELYGALKGGTPPAPAFPPLAQASEEDAAYLVSEKREADRAFWTGYLDGLSEIGAMAPGRPVSAHRFHRSTRRLTGPLLERLRALAQECRVTWPDVLTGLVSAYCRRFMGEGEVVVGVPHMGRLGSRAARVPCTLMNVLPLRVRVDEDRPLADFLGEVAKDMIRARRHGRYRSEQMRRELGLLGGRRRLFGPMVNVQPFDVAPKMKGLDVRLHILGAGAVDDITFTFRGDAIAELTFEVDSNPGLYGIEETAAHGARLAAFIGCALDAATLAEVPTASPQEAQRFLFDVNATAHQVPDTTLTALIETGMRRTPDAPALRFEGRTMSHGELDRRSAALARRLRELGAGRDGIVAVVLPRSFELVVALVAILRAGAAYLPLDPDHPRERIARILRSARPVCVLAGADAAELFGDDVLRLDPASWPGDAGASSMDESQPGGQPSSPRSRGEDAGRQVRGGANPASPAQPLIRPFGPPSPRERGEGESGGAVLPCDMAYVIYTSGSTGEPKGVVVEHRAIVNRLEWMRVHYGFAPHDRILQKTPATFDVSVWEFFLPLTSGATLVIAPPGAHRDPTEIARLIREEAVTTAHFVPSMLSAFLAAPAARGLELARVFCSGEELTGDLRDRFHRIVRAELHNLYGPTEAAVDVSFWPAGPDDASSPVPIGFPVWNTRLYVLDGRMRPVPAGVVGDLWLGGVQLARGYLGRDDLTGERFLPDPFLPGERVYRTGDLARFRGDGAVVFLGRSDHQVKVRGLRIELGEIEAAIMASGLAAEAGLIAREDRPGDRRIVAYLVPGPGYSEEALRRHLGATLPDYMVPAAFVTLDALPVTANGKLDRAALPAPEFSAAGGRRAETPTEAALSRLFAEVLGLTEPPGAEADFFALGGDSLLAVTLMLRVNETFGRDPGLGALFERPVLSALADALDAETALSDSGLNPLIRLAPDGDTAPLFVVHPAGGIAWCYRGLARALGRGVYGLQAPTLDPAEPAPESLEALAEGYVARIRAVRPQGPYHLAGWSVGGIIAHAMAVRLEAAGEAVGLLALLDAYPAECWRAEAEPDETAALRALLAIAGYDPEAHPDLQTRENIVAFLRAGDSPLGNLPPAALDGVVRSVLDTNRLVRGHYHRRYGGALTHVRAALDHQGTSLSPELWQVHAASVAVIDVPFRHSQLMSPGATAAIAPELARLLAALDNKENAR